MASELPSHIQAAIKCGPVPVLRDWRSLASEQLTRAERAMRFCERYGIVPEGKLRGQNIVLADFQQAFFYAVFDNPRRTRRAYLSMARKNSKTATIALILLVFLIGPEAVQNSRLSSGAMSREQAAEVFNYAAKMIRASAALAGLCRIVDSGKRIIGLPMNVEYKALSAEGKTAHGGSPLLLILDEAGQIKGPSSEFVDALETSQGAYEGEALFIVISTQAPTDSDLLSIWLDDAERSQDPAIISHLYTAEKDCDLMDRVAWQAANPALGLFRSVTDIEDQARKADRLPTDEARFRVLTLNQRVNMVALFVTAALWKLGNEAPAEFEGAVFGGLDLSATTDLTSLVLVNRRDGFLNVSPYFWMPADTVQFAARRDKAPYDVWVRQGLIKTTPGKAIDYGFVARDIGEICKGLPIEAIAFDRWRMEMLKTKLDDAEISLPTQPFGQGFQSMSPAVDALEVECLNETIRHGGHPVLAMCAANAVIRSDPAGNRKLDKDRSYGRIDGMVALAMALAIETRPREKVPSSPWDDPNYKYEAA